MGSGTRHGGGAQGWTWDTQPPSLPPAKSNPFRTGFPSCAPKSEELKSFPARTMSTARDISTPLWQKFGQRANMQAMAYYNRTGEGKRPCNILTRDSVGTGKDSSKLENSPLISDSVCPYNVLSVMQANQKENFRMKSIKSACTSLRRKGAAHRLRNGCTCLHTCGGKGTWRRLLWLCESCTKCQECSSLFARAYQVPTQVWQLGLFGENGVG